MRKLKHITCSFDEHRIVLHAHKNVLVGITLLDHPGVYLSHLLRVLKLARGADVLPCACARRLSDIFHFGSRGVLVGITTRRVGDLDDILKINTVVIEKQDRRQGAKRATNPLEV